MRTLMSTIQPEVLADLTPAQLAAIRRIDAEDFGSACQRIAADLGRRGLTVDDQALQDDVLALQQYYALAVLDPEVEHAMTSRVDPLWEAHILGNTRRYFDVFCAEAFGGPLHHIPFGHNEGERARDAYRDTLRELGYWFDDSISPSWYLGDPGCFHGVLQAAAQEDPVLMEV